MTKPINKINIITLGCSKNIVDSEVLIKQLDAGNLIVEHDAETTDAQTVIINTCGFISDAKEESIETILRYAHAREKGEIKKLSFNICRFPVDARNGCSLKLPATPRRCITDLYAPPAMQPIAL